ncbi:PREDICTED: epsin-2 isoform X2 [Nicrophorus vespilloides]|uniref:Epsin-2 isoform X2 n=1 Tax=Nicrophorus vespilloides TaxID=110193 RepID=A0ABM1MJ40_NICVS|nr:PREDICTED: epsin-2 isoform X2 [Nicrophorus vespilloides]
MKRTGGAMQVNVAGLRRNLMNLAHNYSDAQRKVREATSNDTWGPSSTIMAEISDLTYNVLASTEIMQMIWKRLNDHGRNWRHVYKALVLLEYLIKTGSEKVGQQCKENIYAIQTLKDFQHMDEAGKDQGQNVREKAKQLVALLNDDERLKSERARALKAKERFAQNASGFGSDGGLDTPASPRFPAFQGSSEWNTSRDSVELPRDLEVARPQTAGEEELQLQLALAMSREEAEQEEQKRRSDDVRLQLALSQSQQDFKTTQDKPGSAPINLLDVGLDEASNNVDPWGMPQAQKAQAASSPWRSGGGTSPVPQPFVDPWIPTAMPRPPSQQGKLPVRPMADPWNSKVTPTPLVETAIRNDPWSPVSQSSSDLDDFDAITNRNRTISPLPATNGTTNGNNNNTLIPDPFELNLLGDMLPLTNESSPSTGATKKTPHSFLGENSALVNLDNLVTVGKPANQLGAANPFSDGTAPAPVAAPPRPIFNPQPPKPTMNQIKQTAPFIAGGELGYGQSAVQAAFASNGAAAPSVATQPDPWAPAPATTNTAALGTPWMKPGEAHANPFLS